MLMERFYENVLGGYEDRRPVPGSLPSGAGERMTKVAALREAKGWLREWQDRDGRQPYAHPYYWAGFVLIGEAE